MRNKVRTTKDGVTTIHIYSKDGQLLADHKSNGQVSREYAYLRDRLVANITKSGTPPPVVNQDTPIPINLRQTLTTEYGFGYGSSSHKNHLIVSFAKPNNDTEFCADGLHISSATEVRVELNGTFLGYMSTGHGKKACFDIPKSRFRSGTNTIKFIQANQGAVWGITNIRLGRVVITPILMLLLDDEEES